MSKSKWDRESEGFVEITMVDRHGRKRRQYVYRGEYYIHAVGKLTGVWSKLAVLLITLCSAALLWISVSRSTTINSVFFAGGISFLAAIPMLFVLIGTLRFLMMKDRMQVQQYRECRNSLFWGGIIAAVLLLVSVAGGIYWVCAVKTASALDTTVIVLNALVFVLQAVSAWLHRKKHYQVQWEETE